VSDTRTSMHAAGRRCSSRPAVSCQGQPPRGSHGLHVEDVRQRALALQLVAAEVEALGFRYICTMDSDSDLVPHEEFQEEFDFESFVRLRLTDAAGDTGRLLGIRFDGD
jgi:Uncharacterised protein conserved in bacteria (DUF2326)